MKWMERRQRFRALLDNDTCIYPASVCDPISGRIAESLGFELAMMAGSVASWATLGAPDVLLITLTEFVQLANRNCQAANVPLLVDADHGYGNAINVMRTVQELEIAGVAGLTIEDTTLPAAYGTTGKARLIPIEEGVGKMKAALAARQDTSLVIVGRTSALSITGLDDMLARVRAYERVGVDAIFVAGIRTAEQLAAVSAAISLPLILGPTAPEMVMNRPLLASHHVRVCLQGHLPFMAAVQAMYITLSELRNGAAPEKVTNVASTKLMRQVTKAAEFEQWARDYLGA
jgi:carboxyvinyl-carboxyphosphonate phosphorylmutase